jgi:predicted O-methyltransferase YrrM
MDTNRLPKELPHLPTSGYEWLNALDRMRDVGHEALPCAMGLRTREFLFHLIREMEFKRVLDIGTYLGTSALNFALAVGEDGLVTTVDITPDHHLNFYMPSPAQIWREALVEKRIEQVFADSRDFLRMEPRIYDLISIDGWHQYDCVMEEIRLASYRLRPGGVIFLDDIQPPYFERPEGIDYIPEPYQAVQTILEKFPELRMEIPVPGTAVLLRK